MSKEKYSTMAAALAQVPDPRNRRGQRHDWLYLLEVITAALMAGQRSGRGMAQWAREHASELVAALQPAAGQVPSAATIYRALAKVPITELEAHLASFSRAVDEAETGGEVVTLQGEVLRGQSLDGKRVCGASAHGTTHHLVSLVRHESAVVLAQAETQLKLGERRVAQTLLTPERLAGTLTTLDALHTQRQQAVQILAAGGHYLMAVKRNQRTLYADIDLFFTIFPATTPVDSTEAAAWGYEQAVCIDKGHGRLEVRTLERLSGLDDYLDWPGLGQVLRRTCRRTHLRTGKTTTQVRYGITSLAPAQVSLAQMETCWRRHWTIENKLHYVRDVSLGEDAGQMRTGHAPQALAALRNAVIALLRFEGWPCLPTAFRHFAAHPQRALHLMGALAS
jgi:predicted transposase YbfD/YdcC